MTGKWQPELVEERWGRDTKSAETNYTCLLTTPGAMRELAAQTDPQLEERLSALVFCFPLSPYISFSLRMHDIFGTI